MKKMKKLLIYISLFFFLLSGALAQQPQAQVPNDKLHKEQYKFDGAWLPDHDAAEIGPSNFKFLQNMRYGPNHPVGTSGYTKINTTALSTYTKIRSGHQLRTDRTKKTYTLVNTEDASGNSRVYQNQTSIPDQGDFEATELHTDATGAGLGRFSDAPQGNVAYCNEKESYIWPGEESRVGAVFTLSESLSSELITTTANRDFSVASDWTNVDIATYDETDNLTLEADASGQYCTLAANEAPMTAGALYRITFDSAGNEVLMLHCDGADESTTFTDSSDSGHTATATGAEIDTDYKKFGSGSGLFGGTDYLTIPDHPNWFYGSDRFAIDFWIYHESDNPICYLFDQFVDGSNRWNLRMNSSGYLYFEIDGNTVVSTSVYGAPLTKDAWHHVAVIRGWGGNVNDWAICIDGTVQGTATAATAVSDYAAILNIGRTAGDTLHFYGWLDEIRISKGVARWTSNFNPETSRSDEIDWTVKDVGDNDTIATITTGASQSIAYLPSVAGGFRIESNANDSLSTFDNFSLKEVSYADPIDYTEQANNTLDTANNIIPIGTQKIWMVFTTKPAQGIKYVVKTANTTASTTICAVWTGDAFTTVSSLSDGTASGGISLAQNGSFSFDSTVATAKPYHLEGLYLYAYLFVLSDGSAEISHISVDAPWQPVVDVWDGVLRQPIQFQVESAGDFEDYTLAVNYESDIDIPIGGILDGLLTTDNVVIMFEDRMAGIRFQMLAGLINGNAADVTVKYNSGSAWVTVGASLRDETDNSGDTIGKTGLISWSPPDIASEHPVTLFGVTGYAYQITFSATLSGVKGDADEDVLVDLVTGIPAQKIVKAFKFPSVYKNRLLLCSYTEGKEGNRVDFSSSNAPDVFNGKDSSMDGIQSLYFGNTDELTCGTQLYNRYGSNVFATWLALKKNSTYLLTGDDPEDFKIFPVSFTVGCPAPLTLATAEVGFEAVQGVQRNIAFWVSHSGPVMFDGSVLFPIQGINKYFDPAESVCINFEYIHNARGWYDTTFREYNILIPSGSGQETNNVWLVFDLIQKKWYEKSTGIAEIPQSAFTVTDTEGNQYVYAGVDTGHVMRLENGTSWDGTGITYKLATGDFWPSKNIWDKTLIRYLKVVAKRIDEDHTMQVRYYSDTNDQEGVETIWVDTADTVHVDTDACAWASASLTTMELSLGTGLYRLVRDTIPTNMIGWTHGFEFQVTTTETAKAFEPIGWGVQWGFIRDDL